MSAAAPLARPTALSFSRLEVVFSFFFFFVSLVCLFFHGTSAFVREGSPSVVSASYGSVRASPRSKLLALSSNKVLRAPRVHRACALPLPLFLSPSSLFLSISFFSPASFIISMPRTRSLAPPRAPGAAFSRPLLHAGLTVRYDVWRKTCALRADTLRASKLSAPTTSSSRAT